MMKNQMFVFAYYWSWQFSYKYDASRKKASLHFFFAGINNFMLNNGNLFVKKSAKKGAKNPVIICMVKSVKQGGGIKIIWVYTIFGARSALNRGPPIIFGTTGYEKRVMGVPNCFLVREAAKKFSS